MLHTLRKHRRGVVGLGVGGFVALLMLTFGIDTFSGYGSQQSVIRIDDKEVSYRAFYRERAQLESMFRRQFGEQFSQVRNLLNIEQQASDKLISETLLERFVEEIGLTASVSQVEKEILKAPFFGGQFNQQSFDSYLRATGLTSERLEAVTRRDVARQQFIAALNDLNFASDAELKSMHKKDNTNYQFRYLSFPASDFESKVDLSNEEDLKGHFEETSENYRIPRKVEFQAVAFRPAEFSSSVEVTEEDVLDAYERTKHRYINPKQLHLRQIFLKKSTEKPKEKEPGALEEMFADSDAKKDEAESKLDPNDLIRKKLEEALEEIEAGESFIELAKKLTEDEQGAKDGGDMGWLQAVHLAPELRDPAARLSIGETSNVIESESGFHLLYLEEEKERSTKPFEEVRSQVEAAIRNADAPIYAQAEADNFENLWREERNGNPEASFEEFAKSKNREILKTEKPVSASESAPGASPLLSAKVIELAPGDLLTTEVNNVVYTVSVTNVAESHVPEFASVKEEVSKEYARVHSVEYAKAAAEEALTEIGKLEAEEKKSALQKFAETKGATLKDTKEVTQKTAVGDIFAAAPVKNEVFSLTTEEPLAKKPYEMNRAFYLIELSKKEEPKSEDFSGSRASLALQHQELASTRIFRVIMEELKADADIWVDPELFANRG